MRQMPEDYEQGRLAGAASRGHRQAAARRQDRSGSWRFFFVRVQVLATRRSSSRLRRTPALRACASVETSELVCALNSLDLGTLWPEASRIVRDLNPLLDRRQTPWRVDLPGKA